MAETADAVFKDVLKGTASKWRIEALEFTELLRLHRMCVNEFLDIRAAKDAQANEKRDRLEQCRTTVRRRLNEDSPVYMAQAAQASAKAAEGSVRAADEMHKALVSFEKTVETASATNTSVARHIAILTWGLLAAAAVTATASVLALRTGLAPGVLGVVAVVGVPILALAAGMLMGAKRWPRPPTE